MFSRACRAERAALTSAMELAASMAEELEAPASFMVALVALLGLVPRHLLSDEARPESAPSAEAEDITLDFIRGVAKPWVALFDI